MKKNKEIKFTFFGTPQVSVEVLKILKEKNLIPSLIITAPDKARGRGMKMSSSPVKIWGQQNNIPIKEPEVIDDNFLDEISSESWNCFVVVAYGRILPKKLIDIPKKGSINLHYSLLPELRGSSPVEGAIINNINPTGVTAILMDEKMDHGPILLQEAVYFEKWPLSKSEVFKKLNKVGGRVLAESINLWVNDNLDEQEQKHDSATYVQMIKKEDALIDFADDPNLNYRKILAYEDNPKPYFMKDGKRIVINKAIFKDGELKILRVTPEGKKEIDYFSFSS